ncbi:MAG: tyrosine-type recombinase/integrase [Nocardioides sp.]|nr:tyrosine-type recombinase/integrase [Nocardioides sp.]
MSGTVAVTATGPTQRAAVEALRRRVDERRGDQPLVPSAAVTVDELATAWWRAYKQTGARDGTLRAYRSVLKNHLRPAFGDLVVGEVTGRVLDDRLKRWVTETGVKPKTLKVILRHVFDHALKDEAYGLATNPASAMQWPEKPKGGRESKNPPRALRPDEWRAVVTAIREWGAASPRRNAAASLLDVYVTQGALGTRINEVLALRPCDLNLDAQPPVAYVTGSVEYTRGKGLSRSNVKSGASIRALVIPAFVVPTLRRRAEEAPTPTTPIFPSSKGTWLWANNIRRQWRVARTAAGLDWVTPHTLRRTVASIVDRELGLEAASAQLGHARTSTTREHYAALPSMPHRAHEAADVIDQTMRSAVSDET